MTIRESSGFWISMSNWEQTGDGSVQLFVDDALKWDENFYHPRDGGQAMVDELEQRGTLTNGDPIGYDRGVFLGHYRGLRRVEYGGDWIGYHAAHARYPEQHNTSVIVLCNSDGISPEGMDDRVADIVLAKAFRAAKPNAPALTCAVTPRSGDRPAPTLAGRYLASSTGEVFRIVTHDSALVLEIAGQSFPLKPQGPLEYRVGARFPFPSRSSPTAAPPPARSGCTPARATASRPNDSFPPHRARPSSRVYPGPYRSRARRHVANHVRARRAHVRHDAVRADGHLGHARAGDAGHVHRREWNASVCAGCDRAGDR